MYPNEGLEDEPNQDEVSEGKSHVENESGSGAEEEDTQK
jgi:hypothetical protein